MSAVGGPAEGPSHHDSGGEAPLIDLDLPDPERDDISVMEFHARLEAAWAVCDRFDLQTEIWRGRILCAVRDRERRGGEGRGTGFLQWLREREISKTRAYGLIQLAESADAMLGDGVLELASVNQFSKRAFLETAQADPEVQQMIGEAANGGQQITRKQVRRLTDEFTAATSPLLPEEIRQRTAENLLPPRAVAPLVKELAKLPEAQQEDLRRALRDEPELERVKDVTLTARWLDKAAQAALAVRAFQQGNLDFEKAIQEAQRLDALGLLADAVGQAQALESAVLKLHTSWRRLGGLQERLWHTPSAGVAHRFAKSQRQHLARFPRRAGRRETVASPVGGGVSRSARSAGPALSPCLALAHDCPQVVERYGPIAPSLGLAAGGSPQRSPAAPLRLGPIPPRPTAGGGGPVGWARLSRGVAHRGR